MFIVLPLHRESLRQMMQKGLVTHSIKVKVLEVVKLVIVNASNENRGVAHGDIKEISILCFWKFLFRSIVEIEPENILVDYDVNNLEVSNFRCILGDWGSSGVNNHGGTPFYAGPKTFELFDKDLFSFGRLILELFLEQTGKKSTCECCHISSFSKTIQVTL